MTKNKQVKEVLSFLQKNRLDSIVLGVGALSLIGAITGIVLHSITLSKSVPAKKILYKELVIKRDADFEAQKTASITKYGIIEDATIEITTKLKYEIGIGKKTPITFKELLAESIKQDYKLNSQFFIEALDEKIILIEKAIANKTKEIEDRGWLRKSYREDSVASDESTADVMEKQDLTPLREKETDAEFELKVLKSTLKKYESAKEKWGSYGLNFPNNDIKEDAIKELSEPYKTFDKALLLSENDTQYGYHANNVVNSSIGLGLAGVAFIVLSLVLTSTAFKLWKKLRGGTKK